MKSLGVEISMANFLKSLPLSVTPTARVLDVGCGTGIIGATLLQNRPRAELLYTDANPALLQTARRNALQKGLHAKQFQIGLADVSRPRCVQLLEPTRRQIELDTDSFDIVITGGVLGYSKDVEHSLEQLLALVKPGGYYLNLDMHQGPVSRWVAKRYHYPIVCPSGMQAAADQHGVHLETIPVKHFPVRLTRVCYLFRKPRGIDSGRST
jgi:ubiquinone/menaquinone biosynthesis C-methylase UbiE